MATLTINQNCSGLIAGQGSVTYTDNEGVIASPTSVLAAQPSVLTTHTSSSAGTLTMTNSSHGITTGQRVDFYWAGGSCANVTVGTVSGTSVPFTTATGLPIATTPITVGIPLQTPFNVIGNNMSALVCSAPVQSYFAFDASTTDDLVILLPAPTQGSSSYMWGSNANLTNPLSGDTTTSVWMSHSNTAAAVTTMQAAALTH